MKQLLLVCVSLLVFSACSGSNGPSSVAASSASSVGGASSSVSQASSSSQGHSAYCPEGLRTVGYFPTWRGQVENIQYNYLSHILYSFLLPNDDGSLQPLSGGDGRLMQLVTLAQAAGVKVGIAIGGWNDGDDSAFVALAADDATRAKFVAEVIAFVERYQLDGVDMDWEHPSTPQQAAGNALIMAELRVALDNLEGEKFLSKAVVGAGDWAGQYILDGVLESVDFLNLMAYDQNNNDHSSLAYAAESVEYWTNRGLTPAKINLGVPFYSQPNWHTYRDLVAADSANACVDVVNGDYYNGIPTIRTKAAYAGSDVCGMMMWELSQDAWGDASLLKAMWEVVHQQPPSYVCP
ncbi:MAG TPA: glycoside hydrolase family 18 protein [Cellvibrionaceae bacterium]